VNASLAFIEGAKPKGEVECALVMQMACTHTAAMSVLGTFAGDVTATFECPTCPPKSLNAALRPGRERLASARRSQAEPAAGCMAALARVPRAAAGTAITRTENGPPRQLRSGGGYVPLSWPLQKMEQAHEQEA
jgi:hypothetical protein